MQALYSAVALFLLLNLIVGLWRVVRGPGIIDCMLASQLFGTTAVAVILLLSEVYAQPALRDIALIFALLAAITAVAFVQRARPEEDSSGDSG